LNAVGLTTASAANGASDARASPSAATTHRRGAQSWSIRRSILRPRRAHKFQCDLPTRRRPALRPRNPGPRHERQNSRERELTSSCCHHLLPGSAKLGAGPAAVKRGFELDATCASPTTCNAYAAWPIFAPDLHVSAACTRAPSIARKRREERVHTLRPGVPLDACAIVAPSGPAAGFVAEAGNAHSCPPMIRAMST